MESTMKKYAVRIKRNQVHPHIRYDGKKNGLILNPLRKEVPIELLGFGIYQQSPRFILKETKEKEIVLVPQEGRFEAEVNGKRFFGERIGGPFSLGPGKSNASALYIPCNSKMRIRGSGEIVFFEAPALKEKPLFYLSNQEVESVSRGDWVWRRDVTPLISPKNARTWSLEKLTALRAFGQEPLSICMTKINTDLENQPMKRFITTVSVGKKGPEIKSGPRSRRR